MNRKTARENAFILIFENLIKNDETAEEIYTKAIEERSLECDEYVRDVFFGSVQNRTIINETIEKHLLGWKRERVSFVSSAVLTLASYEMMFMEDIPVRVSINEAVELAKKYDDDKAYALVNGVLNAVAEDIGRK